MAASDLNSKKAAQTVKIAGADPSTGASTNFADVDAAGNLKVGGLPIGAVNETAPTTDIASSGLNGRLQRIAQRITSLIAQIPATLGQKASAASMAVTLSTEQEAEIGPVTETAPATDIASSGLNGRLQRIAQRISSLIALVPTSLGQKASSASFAVVLSTEQEAQQGAINETAPATDIASSGHNGRLQRIAQRITSLIALLPASLGQKPSATSLAVTLSSEQEAELGIVTETAPTTDIASSGLNGRLQRIAQRLSSLIALVPVSLGQKASAASFAVTLSTEQEAELGALTETAPTTDIASSGLNGRLQRIAQRITALIALIPTTTAVAFFTRISDGTSTVSVSTGGDLGVVDGLSGGGLMILQTFTTANTAIEIKCGASRLTGRKLVTFQAVNADFYWGYANTVTSGAAGNGTKIAKGATARWSVDPSAAVPFQVWAISATASATSKTGESL